MSDDILAPYRKTPLVKPAEPPKGRDEYTAFGTKDKVQRLSIRTAPDAMHAPGYNILYNISSDGEKGTHFVLVYSIMMVFVRGRNLQKAVFAIQHNMADYIQSYDADRWPSPGDDKAAFIESIEIKVVGNAFTADDLEH